MAEVAQRLGGRRSRWSVAWDALRGRERAAPSELDESVSFAELVWAHHERQEREIPEAIVNGPWDQEYRRRLKRFKDEHGEIVESYWCRYEASGAALTELQLSRRLTNLYRRDWILRLHTATDWRTENAPVVARYLHQWKTAGIKASEVLRESSERIALQRIFEGSTRLLAFVDREAKAKAPTGIANVVAEQEDELAQVEQYYARAGENSARIVYFKGMVWGTLVLALVVGSIFLLSWSLGWLDPTDTATYTLFTVIGMGAAGAILSVMTRMAKENGFNVDYEVGRKSVRFLGGLRPWIGALFALVLYLALKSNIVELLQASKKGIYFFATIAFLAGFSERRAKVLLDSAIGNTLGDDDADEKEKAAKSKRAKRTARKS
jgi:hypothetical protein